MAKAKSPSCPYCNRIAQLVSGDEIYSGRVDLAHKKFWKCTPCQAWVGTHLKSITFAPMGRLANQDLRKAKQAAHKAFDPLWRLGSVKHKIPKQEARIRAYKWLSESLNIDPKDCHIGMFDIDMCNQVVKFCEEVDKDK